MGPRTHRAGVYIASPAPQVPDPWTHRAVALCRCVGRV